MNRWILLLRGVSQTGKNRVPMTAFREALIRAGFQNTRTWIQSGNALVETPKGREETRLLAEKALKEDVGADILVIVKTAEDIRRALAGNPFPGLDSARVFYGFYNEAPSPQKAAPLLETDFGEDRLALGADAVYTYIRAARRAPGLRRTSSSANWARPSRSATGTRWASCWKWRENNGLEGTLRRHRQPAA